MFFTSIFRVCFLTYGVNIPVRVSALMRSRSAFSFLTRRNADVHVRVSASIVVLDRIPPSMQALTHALTDASMQSYIYTRMHAFTYTLHHA